MNLRTWFPSAAAAGAFLLAPLLVADDEFTPLFDGKSLDGWVLPDERAAKKYQSGEWTVENGAICGRQKPDGLGSFLRTEQSFGDFEVELEVDPTWGCDSGIWLRTRPNGQCLQVFVDYLPGGNVGFMYGQGTGGFCSMPWELEAVKEGDKVVGVKAVDKYDGVKIDGLKYAAKAADFNRVWKHGKFNTLKIRCEGRAPMITTWVNGVKMMELDGTTFRGRSVQEMRKQNWEAASLWNEAYIYKTLGDKGSVALQVHPGKGRWNDVVRYRNIRIKEL